MIWGGALSKEEMAVAKDTLEQALQLGKGARELITVYAAGVADGYRM